MQEEETLCNQVSKIFEESKKLTVVLATSILVTVSLEKIVSSEASNTPLEQVFISGTQYSLEKASLKFEP